MAKRTFGATLSEMRFCRIGTCFIVWTLFLGFVIRAEGRANFSVAPPDSLFPRVFFLGEFEKLEELLNQEYPKGILYPYKNNSHQAFAAWARMLWEIEKFGDIVGFDIRGIKAFATFYFDRQGHIRHIAYSLKGNSRYFPPAELEDFFIKFMESYRLPITSKFNFQHQFTLSLPYPRLIERN